MSDSDKEQLVNDMLADMCGLIGKTLALIPPEYDKERLSACAFVLDQMSYRRILVTEGIRRQQFELAI